MAEENKLGARGAKWPRQPSERVATYDDKMLRTLMTPAHLNALLLLRRRTRRMALIVVRGYQSSKAADEARVAKVKHTWADLRAALEGAELEEIWQGGAWRGEERGEGGEEGGGAPMPAEFANLLKANKMAVTPAAGQGNRGGAERTGTARSATWRAAEDGETGARGEDRRQQPEDTGGSGGGGGGSGSSSDGSGGGGGGGGSSGSSSGAAAARCYRSFHSNHPGRKKGRRVTSGLGFSSHCLRRAGNCELAEKNNNTKTRPPWALRLRRRCDGCSFGSCCGRGPGAAKGAPVLVRRTV